MTHGQKDRYNNHSTAYIFEGTIKKKSLAKSQMDNDVGPVLFHISNFQSISFL